MNNRQIKFRVWDNRNKNCVGGPFEAKFLNNPEYTVQQFTGLTDQNGKEIYEGDILTVYNATYKEYHWGEVIWRKDLFGFYFERIEIGLYYICLSDLGKRYDRDWHKLGNKFEHPELLRK